MHVQQLYTSATANDELQALHDAQSLELEARRMLLLDAQDDLARASETVGALRGKVHALEDAASGLDVRG